jgi:hypothetical protein
MGGTTVPHDPDKPSRSWFEDMLGPFPSGGSPGPGEPGYSQDLMRDIASAAEQSERSSKTATVSDHPPPETPTGAARALIAWFAGALAFESVHAFASASYVAAAGYFLGAMVVAIGDYKLKAILVGSPRLVRSLNEVASDARWWVGAAMVSLLVISISPYVEQGRWPFAERQSAAPKPATSSAPAPAQSVPIPRRVLPTVDISGDLTILSNEEVRQGAYVLGAQIENYVRDCLRKSNDIDRNASDVERGVLKLKLDASCSKDFRTNFLSDVLKVQTELRRRLKEKDPSRLPYIEFANGILGISDMGGAETVLIALAKMLQ